MYAMVVTWDVSKLRAEKLGLIDRARRHDLGRRARVEAELALEVGAEMDRGVLVREVDALGWRRRRCGGLGGRRWRRKRRYDEPLDEARVHRFDNVEF